MCTGYIVAWLPRVIGAGVCVNGSALVLCGRDMWFLGGSNVCAIFLCTLCTITRGNHTMIN
jgi:hypothetical protein